MVGERMDAELEEWCFLYALNMRRIGGLLDELQNHPTFKGTEDLGDYVETLGSLMSFRPHTRDNIEDRAHHEYYG